mgnify:CR=1 FL=1
MKKILTAFFSLFFIIVFAACDNTKSYSELQDEEIVTIENYIKKNNIQVVTTKPADNAWGTNVYYKTASGLYIHIVNTGDKTDSLVVNSTVGYRVIEYLLDEKKTIQFKNWEVRDYNNPILFTYGSSTAISSIGTGMHEAIGFMKYKNSEAKVIVPSGLNISTYNQKVIPVGSDIKITVIN